VLSRSRVTPGLPRSEQRVHNIAEEVVAAVEEAEQLIASQVDSHSWPVLNTLAPCFVCR
jgi:hypothetical protein